MIKGWSLAMVATWLLLMLILGVIFVAQGEAEARRKWHRYSSPL